MKNTRKKLLVSSVAALLVSAMALSTATFAWFTSSTTTTANGLNVKTIQSSELVISKSDKNWGQTINYNQSGTVLRPASSDSGSDSWFTATAAAKGSYAKDGDFKSVANELGAYVYKEQLNIANKGSAAVDSVKIKITNFNNNYGRIALVPADANGNETGTFANCIYDTEGEDYEAAKSTTATTKISPSTDTEIIVGTLDGKAEGADLGGAKYYNLYVWFEGQDTDCYDTNAGQSIGDITFTISGTTAVQTTTAAAQG